MIAAEIFIPKAVPRTVASVTWDRELDYAQRGSLKSQTPTMNTLLNACAAGLVFTAISLAQQPAITGLLNNYSFVQPGLPNYGIAQGSIVDIFGTNLADAPVALQSIPLPISLAGVSANVTVHGVTAALILYYVEPTQVAAILPSSTPVGSGQIIVTNQGRASAPFPIQVVPSAFGILTFNGAGYGAAAGFDSKSAPVELTAAIHPGEFVTIWGTGLGAVTGDETQVQTPRDLTNVPIEVDIGGVPAAVSYHGRSIYPGVDQINIIVPAGLEGCFVSLVVRTGTVASNFTTIPVTAAGRTCSDPIFGLSAAQLQTLSGNFFFARGTISIGKDVTTAPGQAATTTDSASALFISVPSDFNASASLIAGLGASLGSCMVYGISSSGAILGPDFNRGTSLDAGSALNVAGPTGSALMTVLNPAREYLYTKVFDPGFIPGTGGAFTFDHIPNDPESGFKNAIENATITIPAPLVWTNQTGITSVDRSQGVTVTWSGGDPNTYVSISGSSVLGANSQGGAYFNCSAPVSAGKFTIPSAVLESLPASESATTGSFLRVENRTNGRNFSVAGVVDIGIISGGWSFTTLLGYR
jgi:uncharacterized protein (TIGR03437 family)